MLTTWRVYDGDGNAVSEELCRSCARDFVNNAARGDYHVGKVRSRPRMFPNSVCADCGRDLC